MEEPKTSEHQIVCTYQGCVLEFPSVSSKAKHVKEVHGGGGKKDNSEKTIKCSKCDKYFKKNSYVRLHEKRVHNKNENQNQNDTFNESTASLNSTIALENPGEFSDMASADDTLVEETVPKKSKAETAMNMNMKLLENSTSTPLQKEKNFKCSQCDKMFGKRSYARLHEKRIHKEKDTIAVAVGNLEEEQGDEMLLMDTAAVLTNIELEENPAEVKTTEEGDVDLEPKEVFEPLPQPKLDSVDEYLAIPGSSKDRNPVFNIYESPLYTSKHPLSRVSVESTGKDDFKCKVCGLTFLTKRSQVKHFKGHGTYLNLDFLTNFVDRENEASLKNTCLRKSSIGLKIQKIDKLQLAAAADNEDFAVNMMLEDQDESEEGKMSLSEICDDLMDIGEFLI
eukprot:GFUD01019989.1.p1 GENE.GFUD01019989.1~~GFUD01019989.1.p1  ORF type:complete len:394 (-),score=106.34 GFUD01019989.1:68-1249(-)